MEKSLDIQKINWERGRGKSQRMKPNAWHNDYLSLAMALDVHAKRVTDRYDGIVMDWLSKA